MSMNFSAVTAVAVNKAISDSLRVKFIIVCLLVEVSGLEPPTLVVSI